MAKSCLHLVAIDLGASSGRVVLGTTRDGQIDMQILHRFAHEAHHVDGHLQWDFTAIVEGVRTGLRQAAQACGASRLDGVSCSSWAQDFGLLDSDGRLAWSPVSYRDDRTAGLPGAFAGLITPDALVQRAGCCANPVTCLCQLYAMSRQEPQALRGAGRLLFVADLVHHWLCGSATSDFTMATASQLRSLATGDWDRELLDTLGIPHDYLPDIVQEPRIIGHISPANDIDPKLAGIPVVSTAGHDTAAASAVVPCESGSYFLSLGTWAMLGCRLENPLVPPQPARDGWTLLGLPHQRWGLFKSGTGLWLLEECRRRWAEPDYESLARQAEQAGASGCINPADPRFVAPADMPAEIRAACREAGLAVPRTPGEFARVIFDSLSAHYAAALRQMQQVTGRRAECLHVLGGGARNEYLCRAFARDCGITVQSGSPEATALGNLLLQARVLGIKIYSRG